MTTRLQLPCSRLVKEYLQSTYGELITLGTSELDHQIILNALEQRGNRRRDYRINNTYPELLTLELPQDVRWRHGETLSKTKVNLVNKLLTDLLMQQLFSFLSVNQYTNDAYCIKLGIANWLAFMEMHEDCLGYEMVKKRYYRFRKKKKPDMVKQSWSRKLPQTNIQGQTSRNKTAA